MNVSVIIPVYNQEDLVGQTLRSVLRQTVQPAEIVAVDAGSRDASRSVVNSFSDVRLLTNPGGNSSSTRNLGFENTNSDFVAFIDGDDLWHPDHLHHMCKGLKEHPDSPAAFTDGVYFHDGNSPQYSVSEGSFDTYDPWTDYPCNKLGPPVFGVIRRNILDSVNGWSTDHVGCADYHLWLKLALHGPLVLTQDATAGHRLHDGSYGVTLRSKHVSEYVTRWVDASQDVLTMRKENDLEVNDYDTRLGLIQLLLTYLNHTLNHNTYGQHNALIKFTSLSSNISDTTLVSILETFQWFTTPYFKNNHEYAIDTFILQTINNIDTTTTQSNCISVIKDWALSRITIWDLLYYFPNYHWVWHRVYIRIKNKLFNI